MNILSMDQSTSNTGWAYFENGVLTHSGVCTTDKMANDPFVKLQVMRDHIIGLMNVLHPDYVVFEGVQFQANYGVYSRLSQLQGIILGIMFEFGTPFLIIESATWKKHCGIVARKRKEQKLEMIAIVAERFHRTVTEDEADAIGIGLWAIDAIK